MGRVDPPPQEQHDDAHKEQEHGAQEDARGAAARVEAPPERLSPEQGHGGEGAEDDPADGPLGVPDGRRAEEDEDERRHDERRRERHGDVHHAPDAGRLPARARRDRGREEEAEGDAGQGGQDAGEGGRRIGVDDPGQDAHEPRGHRRQRHHAEGRHEQAPLSVFGVLAQPSDGPQEHRQVDRQREQVEGEREDLRGDAARAGLLHVRHLHEPPPGVEREGRAHEEDRPEPSPSAQLVGAGEARREPVEHDRVERRGDARDPEGQEVVPRVGLERPDGLRGRVHADEEQEGGEDLGRGAVPSLPEKEDGQHGGEEGREALDVGIGRHHRERPGPPREDPAYSLAPTPRANNAPLSWRRQRNRCPG